MKFGKSICILNVGGTKYAFPKDVIKDFPLSRVSRLHKCASEKEVLEVCDDYDRERNEFFFDRHSEAFCFIMLYVKYGKLRFVPQMCELSFYNEMIYWGLESSHLEFCCQRRLDNRMSDSYIHFSEEEVKLEEELRGENLVTRVVTEREESKWLERMRNWKTAENNSVEEHQYNPDSLEHPSGIIEAVCIGWFTAECIVRFIVSRDKCEFVKRPLNIIDLLAITPYYISISMTMLTGENSQLQRAGVTLRVLRMMRIFWVIKLARHFLGLQTLGLTLSRCYREMVMLLLFICVPMAIFSALAQLLEHGLDLESPNEDYASIPAACWWVIISMTTVGYGDMYPITVPGRVLGGLCVVSGIVLLALPITFIYHSFVQCYHELKFRSARCTRSLSAEFLN
ncbi:hypothetical protein J4Q44_G00358110 [Coregonus suidteri]|uniref:Potassium voltage-gated channel subfamily G member 3 n=1 Tax=Coregonus suidteri TaxID=861788 RepID=A0AAN8KWN3_9TELE